MWSAGAGGLILPEDASFAVGARVGVSLLVLQVHYKKRVKDDETGVLMRYQPSPTTFSVGAMELHAHGPALRPMTAEDGDRQNAEAVISSWEVSCTFSQIKHRLLPFAFLAHTHQLGRRVDVWLTTNSTSSSSTSIIGSADQRRPQSFYPVVTDGLAVEAADSVAARCDFERPARGSYAVGQGLTSRHEMCDVFILFAVEGGHDLLPSPMPACTKKANVP